MNNIILFFQKPFPASSNMASDKDSTELWHKKRLQDSLDQQEAQK